MTTKRAIPRDEALGVAMELRDQLAPLCETAEWGPLIMIVGSLRRQKPLVGDIELLYAPRSEERQSKSDMFARAQVNLVDELLERWMADGVIAKRPGKDGRTAWGQSNKLAIHVPSLIAVDFFSTDLRRWWTALVIRTGGKDMNLQLTTGAQRLGRKLHAYGEGVEMPDGTVHRCVSEQDVFSYCNVPYKEPWERP